MGYERTEMEGIDGVEMEIDVLSEVVIWCGLLQQRKSSILYANRRVPILSECKRKAVMMY